MSGLTFVELIDSDGRTFWLNVERLAAIVAITDGGTLLILSLANPDDRISVREDVPTVLNKIRQAARS